MKSIIDEKETRRFIELCKKVFIEKLPQNTDVNGHIRTNSVNFTIPGTDNRAVLQLMGIGDRVSLRVNVLRNGTDRAYSNFFPSFPCEETEKYLKEDMSLDEIYDSVVHLSESVDENS